MSTTYDATLYMTLLSAFALLLQRYSAQDDIVVGSPIANRQDSQLEKLIGFFVNSLIMRVQVNAGQNFPRTAGRGAWHGAGGLPASGHLPFERLVEELSPERRLNAAPIFQVVFALQNAPMAAEGFRDLKIEAVAADEPRVRIDLEVDAVGTQWRARFLLADSRDRLTGGDEARWLLHYLRLLEDVAGHPRRASCGLCF